MSAKLSPVTRIRRAYSRHTARAGGDWHGLVTLAGHGVVVEDDADRLVKAYSIQKLAIAVAVLDKVDRGELDLARRVRLAAGDVLGGSGTYHLQPVHGDELTVAGVLTALLLVSDNTAVRLCGRLVPAAEINATLAAKGFARTRVEPAADPARFWLGDTTPRETHDLLSRLAGGTLLAPASGAFLLGVLRAAAGHHDGVRRDLTSAQRARVATKHGADRDERGAARHEAGVMFAPGGAPALVYSLFADGLGHAEDYAGTHPANLAYAALGRSMLDATECC
ncbi:serine hydrolase [Dactylosporangium sp. CA-092794]|uniref:serine hydrolase n=1 Tax=Dactylosporangium sp. CA-092794 TaxID=3239929 RepID=UPI003D91247E